MFGQFFLNFSEDVFSAIKISTNRANSVSQSAVVCHYVSVIFGEGLGIARKKWACKLVARQKITVLSGRLQ